MSTMSEVFFPVRVGGEGGGRGGNMSYKGTRGAKGWVGLSGRFGMKGWVSF